MTRLDYPATRRNREPIYEVLSRVVPNRARVLEIASGSGQHAAWFAAGLPIQWWQPSDVGEEQLASIDAWCEDVPEVRPAVRLDVREPWPVNSADVVFSANLIHIAPWGCTSALLEGSANVLSPGGQLLLYGPFRRGGQHTAPSNAHFDASLRARDPEWGVRDLDEVSQIAARFAFRLDEVVEMPANNLVVRFER